MINLQFNIRIPGRDRFRIYCNWNGLTPLPYKFWEVEVYRSSDVIDFEFSITARQSHSGIRLGLALLGFSVAAHIYDSRHWNYQKQCWETYND